MCTIHTYHTLTLYTHVPIPYTGGEDDHKRPHREAHPPRRLRHPRGPMAAPGNPVASKRTVF